MNELSRKELHDLLGSERKAKLTKIRDYFKSKEQIIDTILGMSSDELERSFFLETGQQISLTKEKLEGKQVMFDNIEKIKFLSPNRLRLDFGNKESKEIEFNSFGAKEIPLILKQGEIQFNRGRCSIDPETKDIFCGERPKEPTNKEE